jgi:non-heme chloroperoxidase
MPTTFRRSTSTTSRRDVLIGAAGMITLSAVAPSVFAAHSKASSALRESTKPTGANRMPFITTKDGTEIFYKDWGKGRPIVFHHGWPLSADDWDTQMLFFLEHGYRVIAHDRRGHGRSTQTARGHDMDTYAADAAAVADALDLRDAVHIGHSTGGGEVARYVASYGRGRVAKAVLVSALPPIGSAGESGYETCWIS